MTLLNVFVDADRALVAVDTRTKVQFPGEEPHESSKLLLIPHSGLLIAGRGYIAFLAEVQNSLAVSTGDVHLDVALGFMPQLLKHAEQLTVTRFPPQPDDPYAFGPQQILVVGWSREHSRMLAVNFLQKEAGDGFDRIDVECMSAAPWDEAGQGPYPALNTQAGMKAAARSQVRFFNPRHPDQPLGGRLVVAEVTRQSMSVRSDIVLPD